MYRTTLATAVAAAGLVFLSACSATRPTTDPGAADPPPVEASDCFTGGPWTLDLEDYASQAEPWMVGLGIPISDFAMAGSQTIQFTEDGLMSVLTDVVSTGILHARGAEIPVSVPSTLGGSGDLSLDETGRMSIENWSSDTTVPEASADDSFSPPVLDFSTISDIGVTCQPGLLSLTTSDSPFVPLFSR